MKTSRVSLAAGMSALFGLAIAGGLTFSAFTDQGSGRQSPSSVEPRLASSEPPLIQAACGTENPYFAVTRFVATWGQVSNYPVLVAVHDTDSGDTRWDEEDLVELSRHSDIGAVNGLAFDRQRGQVFAAAYNRVRSEFGPGGPGAIYRIDPVTHDAVVFAQLPAGPDRHDDRLPDSGARLWVGRTSLGDIDVDDTATNLFAVNLDDRRIYRFALPDGQAVGSFPHGAASEPWAPNARPFGLGLHDGWLFHGVVDSREDSTLPGSLTAYVYRSRPDGSDMRQVLRVDLAYPRRFPWQPWSDPSGGAVPAPAQPYVADVEFRPNGDLIVGLADRSRDLMFAGTAPGEVLAARRLDDDHWVVEPGAEDYYADPVKDTQSPLGALASMPGRDAVVSTTEFSAAAGGLMWYDNLTGRRHRPVDGHEWLYGDRPPIGDVEAMCHPGPRRVVLPVTVRGTCLAPTAADVVLVLDNSSSMGRLTSDGKPKVEAAVNAANGLVDLLAASDITNLVAVVGFNDRAWVEAPLGDAYAAHAALGRLLSRTTEGTRLDLALGAARRVVADRASPANRRVLVVLLTDGLPNHVPPAEDGSVETTVLRAATQLKNLGAVVHTIGLGAPGDYSAELLRGMASEPSMFHAEESTYGLGRLFAELAVTVGCR